MINYTFTDIHGFIQPLLERYAHKAVDKHVVRFMSPADLIEQVSLHLDNKPAEKDVMTILEDIIEHSVQTHHPYFANQLYGAPDPIGIIGDVLATILNTNVHTYEVAPLFTLMEKELLSQLAQLVQWEQYDGVVLAGGSLANQYALIAARQKAYPDFTAQGTYALPPIHIYTSDQSHYSVSKNAILLGLGTDHVIKVKTHADGRMHIDDLRACIMASKQQGYLPLMINATAGTTILGAFDEIDSIADIAETHNIWLHVDASWGGPVLFSQKHRSLLQGLERVDSWCFNPHKMLHAPVLCTCFLTRHADILTEANSLHADYLFQADKLYDEEYDVGDKYIQCGRRPDMVKFWLMWKVYGSDYFGQQVEKNIANAQIFAESVLADERFFLFMDPSFANICFWHIPQVLQGEIHSLADIVQHYDIFHAHTAQIKQRMLHDGRLLINYQPYTGYPNMFRMICLEPSLERSDFLLMLDMIHEWGSTDDTPSLLSKQAYIHENV